MTTLTMPRGQLTQPTLIRGLFWLCWGSYFTAYLGRLNYAACLVEIMHTEGWSKGEAGLIATAFFITYGLGQLINGVIGDHISPKFMVAGGLGLSGLVNLLFPLSSHLGAAIFLWSVNGLVQSMLWSPMVRLLSEWMPLDDRIRACVNINSTVPVGTLTTYGIAAWTVHLGNWRLDFYLSGVLMLLAAVLWFRTIHRMESRLEEETAPQNVEASHPQVVKTSLRSLIFASAIPLFCIALVVQGILKDGVTTWIPTLLEEQFQLPASAAILSTMVVPLVNLGGVYLVAWMNRRFFRNELVTSVMFFLYAAASLALLAFLPRTNAVVSLVLLAAATTFMMGINTLFVSMLPPYYVAFGLCSTVSGILNASAYLGAALSTYGNGALAERFGWSGLMLLWLAAALLGAAVSVPAIPIWKRFRAHTLKI